jgi:glycosyltransferase involved in cell wall biosynthesis
VRWGAPPSPSDKLPPVPSRPEISVVIPTHNRWELLQLTLTGVLAQEEVDLEVVVVDDGSADGTHARLSEHPDTRVRPLRHERPRGVSHARNSGLAEARGEWVAFLDDDDIWAPRKLRAQLDAAAERNADVAFAAAVVVDPSYSVIDIHSAPDARTMPEAILRRQEIPGGCSNLIARTALAREAGGFDPELRMLADWDMWIRLLLRGPAADCQEFLVGYLMHEANMSLTELDRTVAEIGTIERKHGQAAKEHGVTMDGLGWSRWLAGRYRRSGNRSGAVRAYLWGARRYRSPGNLLRAGGMFLGERAMSLGSEYNPQTLDPEPDWLALYRPGGRFADRPAAS